MHPRYGGPFIAIAITVFLLAGVVAQTQPTDTLDIYWIDVEGGSATLIVTPQQQSILMDTGWDRPDDRYLLDELLKFFNRHGFPRGSSARASDHSEADRRLCRGCRRSTNAENGEGSRALGPWK